MKKYKVVTDNLDWWGLNNGDIAESINNTNILKIIELHPDWFEEVKEEIVFTKEDMIDFAEEYHVKLFKWYKDPQATDPPVRSTDELKEIIFEKWLRRKNEHKTSKR